VWGWRCSAATREQDDYRITQHIITNGNIYLPLAELTRMQRGLLSTRTGPILTRYVNGTLFARGMNRIAYSVPESPESVDAVATIIDYQNGGEVQHATIQYLAQRARVRAGLARQPGPEHRASDPDLGCRRPNRPHGGR
jgi:hypothetical protein